QRKETVGAFARRQTEDFHDHAVDRLRESLPSRLERASTTEELHLRHGGTLAPNRTSPEQRNGCRSRPAGSEVSARAALVRHLAAHWSSGEHQVVELHQGSCSPWQVFTPSTPPPTYNVAEPCRPSFELPML